MKRLLRSVSVVGLAFLTFLGGSQVSNAASASSYLGCSGGYKATADAHGWYNLYAEVVGHEKQNKYVGSDRYRLIVKPGTPVGLAQASAQDYNIYNLGTASVYCS